MFKIKLDSVTDVKEFCNICTRNFYEEIELRQGRYIVDAKSIMGIFSLNLLENLEVIILTDDEYKIHRLGSMIKKWIVEE